jgi:enoyl-CoA hydratase
MESGTERLIARKDGHIGWMIFNNPERRNAISSDMWQAIPEVLRAFDEDADVRVIVFAGAGDKAFVSGADISQFDRERSNHETNEVYSARSAAATQAMERLKKPSIAMIRGYCIGGGVGVAVCCDMRICTDVSKFAIPAAKLGLGYGYPGIKRLTDLVGPAFAKEIFFTARQFDANEARSIGLVNRVVKDSEIEALVKEYAETISGNAPLTVNAVKYIVGEVAKDESKRNTARCAELVTECYRSRDYTEGRQAFMEKRKPVFTGT